MGLKDVSEGQGLKWRNDHRKTIEMIRNPPCLKYLNPYKVLISHKSHPCHPMIQKHDMGREAEKIDSMISVLGPQMSQLLTFLMVPKSGEPTS